MTDNSHLWGQWQDDFRCGDFYSLLFIDDKGSDNWVQVAKRVPCVITGEVSEQKGRKWRLSKYMTKSEFYQTLLKACITWEEHEVREKFLVKGHRVFDPHLDVLQIALIQDARDD